MRARGLIAAAGLNVQHTCIVCHCLLQAYGREVEYGKWVCPEHKEYALRELDSYLTCAEKFNVQESS